MPKYTRQIVVFLDILGFSGMLHSFEEEALNNDDPTDDHYHESQRLNALLKIFQNAVHLVKGANCRPYQFSDNLGVAINYITNETENPDVFANILSLIGLLTFEFMKEGYFLRGGVSAGWSLDADDMVVGMPLLTAYNLEQEEAVYPRVMLSKEFMRQLKDYDGGQKFSEYGSFIVDRYVVSEGDRGYINAFYHVTNFEDKTGKIEYLQICSHAIDEKLSQFSGEPRIFDKYRWLAIEFNKFIDMYISDSAYLTLDTDELDYSQDELAFLQGLKLSHDDI
jgi:hypothetical protein